MYIPYEAKPVPQITAVMSSPKKPDAIAVRNPPRFTTTAGATFTTSLLSLQHGMSISV
jgi:hypothetical protein